MRLEWRSIEGIIPMNVLLRLPLKGRIEEVRRHLSLPVLEAEPRKRIPYVTVLPWNESIELQSPFIKSGDADCWYEGP